MGLFGGDSTSTNETKNYNIDQRLFQEAGAVGATSSNGGTSIVNVLDGGAIKEAFGLGHDALNNVTDLATGALSGAHHTEELALSGALSTIEDTKNAYRDATEKVATAYEDAKIGNRSGLMMGALGLGVVALVIIGRKGSK